jgi:hypothetical protein
VPRIIGAAAFAGAKPNIRAAALAAAANIVTFLPIGHSPVKAKLALENHPRTVYARQYAARKRNLLCVNSVVKRNVNSA